MRIESIANAITSEIKKVENSKKPENNQKSRAASADSSEFSTKAQRLSDTRASADIILNKIANEPEIRQDKIDEVRQKIANGFYDSPEFLDKLTDKLLVDLGVVKSA
jgi:anti-sigma28 factor (negative regulator of flagellin synthesis)